MKTLLDQCGVCFLLTLSASSCKRQRIPGRSLGSEGRLWPSIESVRRNLSMKFPTGRCGQLIRPFLFYNLTPFFYRRGREKVKRGGEL